MGIIGMNTYPWSDNFAWGQFFKMTGFALLIALVATVVIGLIGYWMFRDNQITQCATCGADNDTSRGGVIALFVFVILLVSVPTLYRLDDNTVNTGNNGNVTATSQQEVESLEDTIAGQLEARSASMGYEVLDTDVEALTTTVRVGTCDVELDESGPVMEFVVPQDGGNPAQRFEATNPFPLLRDARANLNHPLRRCFTAGQLDPAT